jgi:hypothetical protein
MTAGTAWVAEAVDRGIDAAPVGLYVAGLWYFEELYPLAFGLSGLALARRAPVHRQRNGGGPVLPLERRSSPFEPAAPVST